MAFRDVFDLEKKQMSSKLIPHSVHFMHSYFQGSTDDYPVEHPGFQCSQALALDEALLQNQTSAEERCHREGAGFFEGGNGQAEGGFGEI